MIKNQRLIKYIDEMQPTEEVFKKAYLLQSKYGQVKKVRFYLAQMGIQIEKYWLPMANSDMNPYMTQKLTNEVVSLDLEPVGVRIHPRYQAYSLHCHEFYECIIVLKGKCTNIVEGQQIKMNTGDICIIPPNTRHMIGVYDDYSIVMNLIFTTEILTGTFLNIIPEQNAIGRFFKKTATTEACYDCIMIRLVEDSDISFLLEEILWNHYEPDNAFCSYSELMLPFLLRLCTIDNEKIYFLTSMYQKPEQVEKIIYYIQTNMQSVTLPKLAEYFGYAPSYLGRIIKQQTGLSFTSLLKQIRISQACYYLTLSELSISEISRQIGYESMSYFVQVFKQNTGTTPFMFRKMCKSV